ncbi:MAG: hypothetical protein QXF80_07130 [Thermoplasmatales archaeon]
MIKVMISIYGMNTINYFSDLLVAYSRVLSYLDCLRDWVSMYIEISMTDPELITKNVIYSKYGYVSELKKNINNIYESLLNKEELI